jgi:hypothetical protein
MPLSDKKLRRNDLQPAIDKLYGKVKGWSQGFFSIDARLVLVKHVLPCNAHIPDARNRATRMAIQDHGQAK